MVKKIDRDTFIERASLLPKSHLDDFDTIEYSCMSKKMVISCKEHGKYMIRPSDYLNGHRCPKCSNVSKYTTESFKDKIREKYNDIFILDKVDYVSSKEKVIVTCREHGDFLIRPNDLLNGYGCPKCGNRGSGKNGSLTNKEFITKARNVHSNRYDYSHVNYVNSHKEVSIICGIHGEFKQLPYNHLNGSICPQCAKIIKFSRMAENIYNMLLEQGYEVEKEKEFDWLVNKRNLKLDFFLPKYNIAIEVQGEQHFKPFDRFGGEIGLLEQIKRDDIKKKLCEDNGIKLFYITKKNNNINEIISYINEGCREEKKASEKTQKDICKKDKET